MTAEAQRRLSEHHLEELLAPVGELTADGQVSEIMINGPCSVFFERGGRIHPFSGGFGDRERLMALVRAVAQYLGKQVSPERPILEGRLPDGTRIEAVIPPAAPTGPVLSLRRFSGRRLGLDELLASGSLTQRAAHYLAGRVTAGDNVLVSGGTGSGKTSMLNVLSSFIPQGERVIVIEDARELQLQSDHVVQLEARPPDAHGRGCVTIGDLFRATLRLRPDRIVVGEIRGEEALDLVQAMTSGHGGGLSSIHASHPTDALHRLETCCLMANLPLGVAALRPRIASAIDLIVQTDRRRDGLRRVTHISAIEGFGDVGYRITPRFALDGSDALAPCPRLTGAP